MILDKEIEVNITIRNVYHYKIFGYNSIIGDKLIIQSQHLSKGSVVKIRVKCDNENCNKGEKLLSYNKYFKNTKNLTQPYCCSEKCAHDLGKNKKTNLERHGKENYTNRKQAKETTIERYGVENCSQITGVLKKVRQAKLKNHGDENYNNREQAKKTCVIVFGNENPMQNKEIREKATETMMRNYGIKYPMQNKYFLEKSKQTCLKKFGVENVFQNEKIKNKCKETMLNLYGVENAQQNKKIHEKNQKNGKKTKIHEQTGIRYQGGNEKDFLDYCFKNSIKIERGKTIRYDSEGNKNRVYYSDFYLREKNLIIEIKATHWYNLYLEKNLAKQKACLEQGYNFIFIIDFDYDEFILKYINI